MPVPSTFADISETPASNSPQGSETVGTQANEYIQTAFAFIKQLYDGTLKPLATFDMNAQKITNIAKATISTTSTDALRADQLYTIGEIRMWHGAVANIAATWGTGWHLCDGTLGTVDLRDRFVVGAGASYLPGATGGANSVQLTTAQMPSHTHGFTANAHSHVVADPTHSHSYSDPGHGHTYSVATFSGSAGNGPSQAATSTGVASTGGSGVGIAIQSSATGISLLNTTVTGVNATIGSDGFHENRPPYYALCFIEYRGS